MKFMALVSAAETIGPPPPSLMGAIMQLGMEASKAGVLVEQGGLLRTAAGARVHVSGGEITVIDGPFAEAKEVVGGYAVYSVKSKEEVIDWTRRFMQIHVDHWPEYEGTAEVRQIFDQTEFAAGPQK